MVTVQQFEELSTRVNHLARSMEAQTSALQAVADGIKSLAQGHMEIGELGSALPRLQAFVGAMLLAYLHDQDVVSAEPMVAQLKSAIAAAPDHSGVEFLRSMLVQVEKIASQPEPRKPSFQVIIGGLASEEKADS